MKRSMINRWPTALQRSSHTCAPARSNASARPTESRQDLGKRSLHTSFDARAGPSGRVAREKRNEHAWRGSVLPTRTRQPTTNAAASHSVKRAPKVSRGWQPSLQALALFREKSIFDLPHSFAPVSRMSEARAFHTSTSRRASSPYRSRPPPPRNPEEVTLRYYVERKAQMDEVSERKAIDGELMPELSATIVTGDFTSSVAPREGKVPVEIYVDEHGVHLHASGFVPPTPAVVHEENGVVVDGLSAATLEAEVTLNVDRSPSASPGDEGLLTTEANDEVKPAGKTPPTPSPAAADPGPSFKRALHTSASSLRATSSSASAPTPSTSRSNVRGVHSTATRRAPSAKPPRTPEDAELRYHIERKVAKESVAERKATEGELMPELSATIVTGDFPATVAPREEKVPKEVYVETIEGGVHLHASGFVPPTPAAFHEEAGVVTDGLSAAALEADELLKSAPTSDQSTGDEGMTQTIESDEVKPAGKTPPTPPPASAGSPKPDFTH